MSRIIIVLSEDTALAEKHATSLSANGSALVLYPETKLHSKRHFAQVAPLLVAALSGSPPVVIATHSDCVVNALGELVEDGIIPPDDIEVLLGNADEWRSIRFEARGYLGEGWPVGWFIPGGLAKTLWDQAKERMSANALLRIWTDDSDYYIAESPEHAHRLQAATCGEECATPVDAWEEYLGLTTNGCLTIREVGPNGDDQTKPIATWIAERGVGFLCAVEGRLS